MKIFKKIYKRIVLDLSKLLVPENIRSIKSIKIDDMSIVVFENEDVGRRLSFLKDFEKAETSFFKKHIHSNDICFDVGGNIGYFTLIFSKMAMNGTTHVFEPIALNSLIIKVNAELNDISNVVINQVAVGDSYGNVSFSVSEDSAFSSLNSTGRIAESKNITVPIIRIDDYVAKNNIPKIDVLKIDVEGAEELVLKGALGVLTDPDKRPRIIMVELYDPNLSGYSTSKEIIVKLLESYQYNAYVINDSFCLIPYEPNSHTKIYNIIFKVD